MWQKKAFNSFSNQARNESRHESQKPSSMPGIQPNRLIHFDQVDKCFGAKKVLRNINLSVSQGEFLLLTGASGAGKTTLIQLLQGEQETTNGILQIDQTIAPAIVFQDLKLIEEISVFDNLLFSFSEQNNYNYKNFKSYSLELLNFFQLADRLKKKLSTLSGGEKQLLSIIRSLLCMPELLLLDEPTSALDEKKSKKLYELISLYNIKKKMTVVWATHDTFLAKKHTGRLLHLENGKLISSGRACFI